MPNGTSSLFDASAATSCPTRVILKAVRFTVSASADRSQSPARAMAEATAPGPETPTFITASGSLTPWNAPAMKGLSSGTLAKTTSFAQPIESRSAVSSAVFLIASPILRTASIFMPALVEATFTDEQTLPVSESAYGIDSISLLSPSVLPFCTSAP